MIACGNYMVVNALMSRANAKNPKGRRPLPADQQARYDADVLYG
jgi:hypothetical protein